MVGVVGVVGVVGAVGVVGVVPPPVIELPGEPAMPNFMAAVPDWCAPTSGAAASSLKFAIFTPAPKPGVPEASW